MSLSSLLHSLVSPHHPQLQQQIQGQVQETPVQSQAPKTPAQIQVPEAPAQPQAGVSTSETPNKSKTAIPEEFLLKNRLQQYAQKAGFPLPKYHTINEGFANAPKFRSTVVTNGATYTSPNVFSHRKTAEMDVARIALRSLAPQMLEENYSLDQVDNIFYKQILNEYAVKINVEKPIYKTEKADGLLPVFVSSLKFNGKHYVGEKGRNKKESERLAARAAILSVLDSDARTVISKIIKSKKLFLAAKSKVKNPSNTQNEVILVGIQTESNVGTNASKGTGLEVAAVNDNMPRTAIAEPCTGNSSGVSAKPASLHEFRLPKQEASLVEANSNPIIFVPPNSEQLVVGSTSAKKRKRKTKKAGNKVGSDAQVQDAAVPSSQTTTCTVAESVLNNSVSAR